ncbi:MAG: polyprenyl synthetase family protein [Bacteroidales bacterium]|nr:polyprenyl synthetase family protein [Bacteroidales bacterium]
MEKYGHLKKMVNHALDQLKLDKKPVNLYAPVSYILSLGGKRLRPVLTLAACDLFDGNLQNCINAALGIEVFHNFTLLHDDIMDEADKRRGHHTVHVKWNPNIAILSGDTMFALSYRLVHSKSTGDNFLEVLNTFTQTAIEVCEGQQYDMDFETMDQVTIPEYLEMIRLKTAVLLGCSLKIGALSANASVSQANVLYDFGINIGLAFQLKDDYLDAFGDFEKFGKEIGGDIASNKKTYLYLKCLELADASDRKTLLDLSSSATQADSKIAEVLRLFDKYSVREQVISVMEMYFNKAVDTMQSLEVSPQKKHELISYAKWLYKRDH